MIAPVIHWPELRDELASSYGGQLPAPALERDLAELFADRPGLFRAEAERLASLFAAGRVHSPWPLLSRNVRERLDRQDELAGVVGSDSEERERACRRAERWIRNAGGYMPSELELVDELFGEHGPLRVWRDDAILERRMLEVWRRERPRFEACER